MTNTDRITQLRYYLTQITNEHCESTKYKIMFKK